MEIQIRERKIGTGHPTFIIAEMSANHLGNFDTAVEIIRSAKQSGADAIKLQTYTPETMTIDCDSELFTISEGTIWDGRTFYDLYTEAQTPWEWHADLKKIAEDEGLIFFSTAFDPSAVDFLEELDIPAYKIASFEITDIPLIEYVASKGKPILISTGIATLCDIEEAVLACRRMGNDQIILLKCTSAYPAPIEEANLRTIPHMAEAFNTISGLSDHTTGIAVPAAAVAIGASVIEKHFTLDRSAGGPDAPFSLEPDEFSQMTCAIRNGERALGTIRYDLTDKMQQNRVFARSLFVVEDIQKGETFTKENVRSIRPGNGMHPKNLIYILDKKAKIPLKKGTPLDWRMIENR
ncbi:pseudaminic acid synthase [Methanocalculus sp.]|uniref:pseudaminic acid synthase n=1 Tax=Methanocalculus sp. TaxID=2004547 RepID=UPI0026282C6A|nr:pseudaminic acid synthase [Methanocalculus sp.]MDG6249242.1 pseudaminic acid synthase [Methanocalculus sp.]